MANELKLLRPRQGSKWCQLSRPVIKKKLVYINPFQNMSMQAVTRGCARAGGIVWATRGRRGRRPCRRASRWPSRAACRGRGRASYSPPSPCLWCRSPGWSRPVRAAELRTTRIANLLFSYSLTTVLVLTLGSLNTSFLFITSVKITTLNSYWFRNIQSILKSSKTSCKLINNYGLFFEPVVKHSFLRPPQHQRL